MILPLVAAALIAQPATTPRVRQILPNGVKVYVERVESANHIVAVLAFNVAAAPPTPATHGHIHLLEHLLAKGKDRTLDARLERLGMSLVAQTTRDAMTIEIHGSPERLAVALGALRELIDPPMVTPELLTKEMLTLRDEIGTVGSTARFGMAAWNSVFGESGLDPYGDLNVMAKATPETITILHRRLSQGRALSIAVTGDLDAGLTAARIKDQFDKIPAGPMIEAPERLTKPFADRVVAPGAEGVGRSVVIEGVDSAGSLAIIGAALAISGQTPGVVPSFNPSAWRGLVTLSSPSANAFSDFDKLTEAERYSWGGLVKAYARLWIQSQRSSAGRIARLQSVLALQNPTLNLERLQSLVDSITLEEAGRAVNAFSSAKALNLGGER